MPGKAWAQPIVRKIPNKMAYDFSDIKDLKLSCHAEGGTTLYDIEWYKLSSTGTFKKLKLDIVIKNNTNYKIAQLEKMYEQNVTYKCKIIRQSVNHHSSKLVTITLVKGNEVHFFKRPR